MNKNERIDYLMQIYAAGKISKTEHEELFELIASRNHHVQLGEIIHRDLRETAHSESGELPPHIAHDIVRNIFSTEKNIGSILPLKRAARPYRIFTWSAAAAAIVVIAISVYTGSPAKKADVSSSLAGIISAGNKTLTNTTGKPKTYQLSDGTHVTLQPLSTLSLTDTFSSVKREVYLEGEAFFDVAPNPRKPFMVYYHNIVTKVLGTSFSVNTDPGSGNVEVAVRSGRVQVSENGKLLKNDSGKSVILTPNQKVVYKTSERLFETALVKDPQPVIQEDIAVQEEPALFVYKKQKLKNIFKEIETTYGIEIVLENANLYNCVFTGDVSGHDMFTKLKIICLSTNTSYEVNGTRILIKGEGCN